MLLLLDNVHCCPHQQRAFLQGLTWSTPKVLVDAVNQARHCGLDVAAHSALPCLQDIDTAEVSSINTPEA